MKYFDEIKFKSPFLLWAVVVQLLHHVLLCIIDSSTNSFCNTTKQGPKSGEPSPPPLRDMGQEICIAKDSFSAGHPHFWGSSLADLKGLLGASPSHVPVTSARQICSLKWTSRNAAHFWRFHFVPYSSSQCKFCSRSRMQTLGAQLCGLNSSASQTINFSVTKISLSECQEKDATKQQRPVDC